MGVFFYQLLRNKGLFTPGAMLSPGAFKEITTGIQAAIFRLRSHKLSRGAEAEEEHKSWRLKDV